MRTTPAFDVTHTTRRLATALAGFAVALTMVRFAFGQHPRQDGPLHDLEFVA
jgi:hypothetical protein